MPLLLPPSSGSAGISFMKGIEVESKWKPSFGCVFGVNGLAKKVLESWLEVDQTYNHSWKERSGLTKAAEEVVSNNLAVH